MNNSDIKQTIKLLLVEDSKATALQVEVFLQSTVGMQFEIVNVRSLSEALDALANYKFDAMLLDLGLPDSFGLDTFIDISNSAKQLPTVIFTGVDDEETAVEAVRLGAQDYLTKGKVDSNSLTRSIRYAIERKQIQEALREKTGQLIQSDKLVVLGELTAGVVHEMNQPLNMTKITCEDILLDIKKDRLDVSDLKESLEGVVAEIRKMAQIVDNLMLFSRKTTGDTNEIIEATDPIERVLGLLGQQLSLQQVTVTTNFEDKLFVKGDPIRLQQVFMNLISNAKKAIDIKDTGEGNQISIKVFLDTTHGEQDPFVVYEIEDNGVGIPAESIDKVFEPFFTTRDSGKGTGLGLSIVAQIVEEHEGKISVKSVEGEGAVFKIFLPATEARESQFVI